MISEQFCFNYHNKNLLPAKKISKDQKIIISI